MSKNNKQLECDIHAQGKAQISTGLGYTDCETFSHMSESTGQIDDFYAECATLAGITVKEWLALDPF